MASNARTRLEKYGRTPKGLLRDPEISAVAKVCYSIIDEVANYETITLTRLSMWTGVSQAVLRRELHKLRDTGWIEITPVFIDKMQRASRYVANDQPHSDRPVEPEWPEADWSGN